MDLKKILLKKGSVLKQSKSFVRIFLCSFVAVIYFLQLQKDNSFFIFNIGFTTLIKYLDNFDTIQNFRLAYY